ncbi:GntR family transcriptional regulator [Nonomuraea sp. LPB2021202275-12-8]|uniref:GntR family transcriptional regulator n=1 Tax=Nonomuraea sp. LPB2021202275-12-8 TaxID=3120159 RepID=UPI00300C9F14
MSVDQLNPEPLWSQLAAILREQIKAGDYEPRQVLPSEAHLQQEHGVARGTVRRAVRALAEEGYVVVIQGRGTFVAPRESWPES